MSQRYFSPRAFALLEELEANNHKAWFDANRDEFKMELREPFGLLLEHLSMRCHAEGIELNGDAKTMFRQNRDIRFSADKRPYKTNVSGLLTPSGSKRETDGLVYLHLEKDGGFIASGFYQLSPKDLLPIRERIAGDPDFFQAILDQLSAAGLSLDSSEALKKLPKGFEQEADHPFAAYLKLKSFIAQQDLTRSQWQSVEMAETVVAFARSTSKLRALK
ncbi:MAG: DUF2461 domain-containing protein [Opitutales bacterium]